MGQDVLPRGFEGGRQAGAVDRRAGRAAVVAVLLLFGFGLQVYFLKHYPQPILFGDAAGYYSVGQRLQHAVGAVASGRSVSDAFETVRPYLYFLGVGSAYGALDALRHGDLQVLRAAFAALNTLTMLAAFLLARRLTGSFAAGITALVIAIVYPSFSVQTGRLLPDPMTGFLFTSAAAAFAYGLERSSPRLMAAAGFLLGAALLVRSQLIGPVLALLLLCALLSAPLWWRRGRPLAAGLFAGCLPAALAWTLIGITVGGDLRAIESLGNFTFSSRYPYGFWQFLDSDGWMGPYRLGEEPYYQSLREAAQAEPGLLTSRARQVAFTVEYVLSRGGECALLVLDNVYRLYSRPANDYKWDFPFPYGLQVVMQGAIVLCAVAGAAVVISRRPAQAGVVFLPLSLALLHGLSYPWPRFSQPVMPILIALAGALLGAASPQRRRLLALLVGLVAASAAVAARPLVLDAAPATARVLAVLGTFALTMVPFAWAPVAVARRGLALAWLGVALPTGAHLARDTRWHESSLSIGGDPALEQEIAIDADACRRLREASEAFVVMDLRAPGGRLAGATVAVNERLFRGEDVIPTMPRFGESTSAGGRDRRTYPQWWAVPLDAASLPATGECTIRVRLASSGEAPFTIAADHFAQQDGVYEGPSFGEWPHLAAVKLEHDGDYRLPVRRALSSARTRSFLRRGDTRVPSRGRHRIRVLALTRNQGRLVWETPALPAGGPACGLGFWAYSSEGGSAEWLVEDRAVLRFPMGSPRPFAVESGPYRLCYRPEGSRGGMAYGAYALTVPPEDAGRAVKLSVRFRSGMSIDPLFFSLDSERRSVDGMPGCCDGAKLANGLGRLIDASANSYPEATGRWSVAEVF